MYMNKKEIEDIVNRFCENNHCPKEIFEVSEISERATGGKNGCLQNTTKVVNCNCTYVIKYYQKLDIIIIWNYSKNHHMSYKYETIKQKLSVGIRFGDKGKGYHSRDQSRVFFDEGDRLYQLLQLVTNPI